MRIAVLTSFPLPDAADRRLEGAGSQVEADALRGWTAQKAGAAAELSSLSSHHAPL